MQRSGERHVSAKGLAQTRVHSEAREAPAPDLTLYASCCTKPFAVLGRGVMLMTRSRGCRAKGRALRRESQDYSTKPARSGEAAGLPEGARMAGTGCCMEEDLGSDRT